ncbi:MAG: hypothetical protein K2K70_12265 [Lachnospiraceae bacterium]|nr:hypothetical protein [Lachnospiraceae bacterium]
MKWKNKGHEFDELMERKLRIYSEGWGIYLFGAGIFGKQAYEQLAEFPFKIKGFIDNDISKQGTEYCGLPIISLNQYWQERECSIIVVTVAKKNAAGILYEFGKRQFECGRDYFIWQDFLDRVAPVLLVYQYNKLHVPLAQICVTERCSLKCKKCAHGCYATASSHEDLSISEVMHSADSFFTRIDYIKVFVLIGGEPLLYKELEQAVAYIGEHYRKQIGLFEITTNGTIMPSDELLHVCKKYNVLILISNYGGTIPRLKEKYEMLISKLEEQGVSYYLGSESDTWMDYGFEYVDRKAEEEQLIGVFDACATPCKEVRGSRLYSCVMARSVSENLGYNVGENDYLDLDRLEGSNWKKELLEFTFGYSEKGYLDMCNHCHGADAKNHPIPAAEQL